MDDRRYTNRSGGSTHSRFGPPEPRGSSADFGLTDQMQRMQMGPARRSKPDDSAFDPSAQLSVLIEKMKTLLGKLGNEARRTAAETIIRFGKDVLESIPPVISDVVDDPDNALAQTTRPFLVPAADGYFKLPFPQRSGHEKCFETRWAVLPSDVANLPCGETPKELLASLNTVFHTAFKLTPDMQAVLSELIDTGADLGHAYGHLRAFWHLFNDTAPMNERGSVSQIMQAYRKEDHDMRASAFVGNHISSTDIPPRRIWDLYSNRVLPYYVTPFEKSSTGVYLPSLSPISHSWRPESERQSVLTTINGKAWSVPIPRGTTLIDIRNELLSLGAEYVFLDVLCLRQYDAQLPRAEAIRKKEWRLDIPTIGSVYKGIRERIIVYLNGLGLPFRDGPVDRHDHRGSPIIGGIDPKSFAADRSLVRRITDTAGRVSPANINSQLREILSTPAISSGMDLRLLCDALRGRSYSNPIDQVASIAHAVCIDRLPVYDPDIKPEVAWDLLVETMEKGTRTSLLFTDFGPETQSNGSWWPTWEQFLNCTEFMQFTWMGRPSRAVEEPDWQLQFLSGSSPSFSSGDGLDAYYHHAHVVEGCRISLYRCSYEGTTCYVATRKQRQCYFLQPSRLGDCIDQDVEYTLVTLEVHGLAEQSRPVLIAEPRGVRRVNGERAIALAKVCVMDRRPPPSDEVTDVGRIDYARKRLVVWC